MHASISDISYTVAASSAYTVVFKQFKLAIQSELRVNKPAKGNSTGFAEPSLLRTAEVQGTGGEH